MRKIRVLRRVMKNTGAGKIWIIFLLFFLACTFVIWLREPDILTWGDAFWYCYAVVTTIGFGDVVVHYTLSRVLSIILSMYAVLVIAIVTGVVVNYYNNLVRLRQEDTLEALMDKLEHLSELPKEELDRISEKVRDFRN